MIIRIIKKEAHAEEVLQDVFLKIWDKIEQYDPVKGKLFTWMVNIARNMAIDKGRTKEFSQMKKTDDLEDYVNKESERDGEEIMTDAIGLKDFLGQLPEERRWIVEHLYFKGYSQSELATEFGIPLGTVKTRLRLAMEQLREILRIK